MKNVFIAAAISGFIATGAVAQNTAFDNQERALEAVEDLEEQINDDAERDVVAFGTEGREVGSYGSISLRATATSDDDTTASDIGVGLRYGTFLTQQPALSSAKKMAKKQKTNCWPVLTTAATLAMRCLALQRPTCSLTAWPKLQVKHHRTFLLVLVLVTVSSTTLIFSGLSKLAPAIA